VEKLSERYLVTGAQLGLFQAFARSEQDKETDKLVEEIIDNQFVGNTNNLIIEDVEAVQEVLIK